MAKKISAQDIFEQEDVFKGIRLSAEQTLMALTKLNEQMKLSAVAAKDVLKSSDTSNVAGLQQFNAATAEANVLAKNAVEVKKLEAQLKKDAAKADQELVRLERERLKLQADLNKEAERATKAATNAAKAASNEASAYKQLEKETRNLKNTSKELAAMLVQLEKNGKQNTKEFEDLTQKYRSAAKAAHEADVQLKAIDKSVGDNFRNVGNYSSALDGMGQSTMSARAELRKLMQEMLSGKFAGAELEKMKDRAAQLKDEMKDLGENLGASLGNPLEQVSNNAALFGQRIIDVDLKGAGDAVSQLGSAVKKVDFKTIKEEVGGLGKGLIDLGKAAISNPFFLLAGALTAVVVYWDEIKAAVNGTAREVEKLGNQNANLTTQNKILEGRLAIEQAVHGQSSKTWDLQQKIAENNIKVAKNELDIAKTTGDINKTREAENKLIEMRNALSLITAQKEKERADIIEQARIDADANYKTTEEIEKKIFQYQQERRMLQGEIRLNQKQYNESEAAYVKANAKSEEGSLLRKREINKEQSKYAVLTTEGIKSEIASATTATDLYEQKTLLTAKMRDEQTLSDAILKLEKAKEDVGKKQVKNAETQAQINERNAIAAAKQLSSNQAITDEIDNQTAKAKREYAEANMGAQAKELYALQLKQEEELRLFVGSEEDKVFIVEKYRILEQQINDKYDAEALKSYQDARNKEDEADMAMAEKSKKAREEAWEKEKKQIQERNAAVMAAADFFMAQSQRKQTAVQKELDKARQQYDTLKALAQSGNIQAQQSLAEQERLIAQKEKAQQREAQRQQKIKMAESIFSTYAAKVEAHDQNALMNTIRDATLLRQFISALPTFFKGTENTGMGGGVDAMGGFLSVLHPGERVVPKHLNDSMTGISNEDLAKIVLEHQTKSAISSSQVQIIDNRNLEQKVDALVEAIKGRPETNIELGEIIGGVMHVNKVIRKGNTTTYNRYRV